MNDPHVVALLYSVEHGASVDYSKTQPLDCDHERFRISVKDKQVRLELKEHYATEDVARKAVERYIRAWELEAGLYGQPGRFNLRFLRAKIVDRNPTPGVITAIPEPVRWGMTLSQATGKLAPKHYPSPPSRLINPDNSDVLTMYHRYEGYVENREPLVSMAYFCLTMLYRFEGETRRGAAKKYRIDYEILNRIGHLTAKGGQFARKGVGIDKELTGPERRFLEEAVKAIILRAAEVAYNAKQCLPKITLADLPV